MIMVTGDVSAVQSSVGKQVGADAVVDDFILPNVHPSVITAIGSSTQIDNIQAGVIETFSVASLIVAADATSKAANVELIEIRTGMGIGGKSICGANRRRIIG